MKSKKSLVSIMTIAWFLFVIVFLSAWNAERFVGLMEWQLDGITPENAKLRTDSWDSYYTKYFRFMEPLAEVGGASYLALQKKSVDNYKYVKDEAGSIQLYEASFDRDQVFEKLFALAEAFERRDIPLIYMASPPRFDKDSFKLAKELDFFGQRDEVLMDRLTAGGIEVFDAGELLKSAGARYLYPFKTDIHLETFAEFETARLLAVYLAELDVEIRDAEIVFDPAQYRIETHDFVGNLTKSTGTVYTHGGDRFELWFPKFETDFTLENPEAGLVKQGAFAETIMNGMDSPEALAQNAQPYWVLDYLQYPSAYCTVKNNKKADACKLLFVIDSYAVRTASYLSLAAGQITVIDPRGEGSAEYLSDAISSGDFDAVIVAAGGRGVYDSLEWSE